ncbi:MAG: O-antigen ligase family protein [Chloroflexota bacterium]
MTRSRRLQALLRRASYPAWALLLLALPVTSFPYFPAAMGGEALVRPLSIYPLVLLFAISFLPRLFTRPVSRTVLVLLPFVLLAGVSSALSLLQGIEPALGISVEARVLRGFLTLLIGCAFYAIIAQLPDTLEDLRFSMRWLFAGYSAALAWGTIQALVMLSQDPIWFQRISALQTHISIRPLRLDRISGMTYEPHWFAEQLILVLLPWSLAALLTNTTAFNFRWRRLTVEALLVAWTVLLLPFTFSRSGLGSMLVVVFLSVLLFRPINGLAGSRLGWLRRRGLEVLLTLLVVALPIYLIGARNPFFARLWQYWERPNPSLSGYLSYLGFDARVVYSQAAFNTYQAYPLMGVGLGNYAFYFEEMLPYRPIAQVPEVLLMITPEPGRDRLITAKNLYLRLLAETGIIGTTAFLAFVIANLGNALFLWLDRRSEWQVWGVASLCGLLAFSLSALTFDSFVIPNMWVLFGLITAATRVMIHSAPQPSAEQASIHAND